ncbi:VacJ family lipoprotein [Cellvibrio sp. NN19]|uniref:MlaA family lipoprotein n=1 Tax=Cellvibrio chitinivorans TaxID=3102792 RepID=UPI002B4140D3|nr:VacJ family lipoprotein [Cellvibrio sp. NN19]
MKSICKPFITLLLSGIVTAHTAVAQTEQAPADPDPWQGFNRAMFKFNDVVDRWTLKPLAKVYKFVMPDPLEDGVSNIFDNVQEVPNVINGVLQGDIKGAAHDTGRLLVNTTLGIGGLFDVAKYMNLPADEDEDFGQTLAVWGVGQGPYLVLPLLGPATVRDGFGRPVDFYTNPTNYVDHNRTEYTIWALSLLDTRAELLDLEKNLTGDRYVFVRDVYLQRREFLINNGEVADEFGTEEFDDADFEAEFEE